MGTKCYQIENINKKIEILNKIIKEKFCSWNEKFIKNKYDLTDKQSSNFKIGQRKLHSLRIKEKKNEEREPQGPVTCHQAY